LEQTVPGEYDPMTLMQALEVPAYPKLLWVGCTPSVVYTQITAAIKSVQAMVKTLDKLGEPAPRVALLSCVEVVSPAVVSTVWEATLAHMGARGQFGKAIVDGPLGFDLAISPEAVADKGVKTEVNGQADLLVPPDVNSFVTLLDAIHLTGTHQAAGIIVGGPCPIALPPHRSLRHVETSLQVASLLV
jgi:phosphotransacetylase